MADLVNAIESTLKRFHIGSLKSEQRIILDALLAKRDCMAVLPTGYGKSLPFQMFVPLQQELGRTGACKIVVCSPLTALMRDQCIGLNKVDGINAKYLG